MSEVKSCIITATVTEQISRTRFKISDKTLSDVYLDFSEKSPKKDHVSVGVTYMFRGLERFSKDTLLFSNSYMSVDKSSSPSTSYTGCMNLKDYHLRHPGFIAQGLIVKIGKIGELKPTSKGKGMRKIVIVDEYLSTQLTTWGRDSENIIKLISEGMVVKISNFRKDNFPVEPGLVKHLSYTF